MNNPYIKPCPFCGSKRVEAFSQDEDDCPNQSAIVRCFDCDAQSAQMVGENKIQMAINAWNKRQAEPICYLNRFTGRTFTLDQQPGADKDTDVYIPLYAAPPAPVAVPDEVLARLEHEANHLTAWHHIDEHSCKVYRRDLLTLVNACRAAMLPGDK
ncbi:hypothetical protein JK004_54 [Cronobacter phage JK004]|nr:hypothetical protein JK004_54 [Cronobacter phage JK004]